MPADPVDHLFTVPPEDFVAERNRLAKKLRSEGDKERGDEVAKLRKPPLALWALNQAARREQGDARAYARAAEALADVQAQRKQGDIRSSEQQLAGFAADLVAGAERAVAETKAKPSDALRQRLHEIVRNAAADPDARKALADGRLQYEPEPAGFAALGQLGQIAPSRPAREPAPKEDPRARERAERRAGLQSELREARREAAKARAAAERAERKVEGIEQALERLDAGG